MNAKKIIEFNFLSSFSPTHFFLQKAGLLKAMKFSRKLRLICLYPLTCFSYVIACLLSTSLLFLSDFLHLSGSSSWSAHLSSSSLPDHYDTDC